MFTFGVVSTQPPKMSNIAELWDALRSAGLEAIAPTLVRHGVTSIGDLILRFEELHTAGLLRWQMEAVLAASSQTAGSGTGEEQPKRRDLPQRIGGKRANLQAALEAALPNQRQRALQLLDQDILAKSTNPAVEARIRTYQAVCRAWQVTAFPLDTENTRFMAASLKAGGYKSAGVYFQAIMGHQQRILKTPIPPIVKLGIKDYIRSIQRGLGVSQLKDSFNALLVGSIEPVDDQEPFTLQNTSHCRDMVVVGLWFMLREAELANARAGDLRLEGLDVCLTIPIHKTDSRGRYTQRTLSCSFGVRLHNLCVWHSAERHLVRLEAHAHRADGPQFPLFPDDDGRVATKASFIEAIRRVIARTGTNMTRLGPNGEETQRFHGHCLRISGAQMLSSSGVELALIQLLGRWTSTAVLRYTQDSAMLRVPSIPTQVLGTNDATSQTVQLRLHNPGTPAVPAASPSTPKINTARPKSFAASVRTMQRDMEQVKQAIQAPKQNFVFRPKAKILHKASTCEADNEPSKWRTVCGWSYGLRTFLRTSREEDGSRRCKKCFNLDGDSSSSSSESSSNLSSFEASSASGEED